ncbi:RIP metalloprotease RseP [Alkalilacustris brevis]|uniref:RIP metalloprotease RseP n=1 Tax=Alkalilacustris brevis TaxID=2026338 RepID=UPI000E0D9FFB|nr:RIP metalloprotease RseP [Alkalilacustris brevis]
MDIFGLIPSFGGLFFTLLAFVVALSIIVAVHEYGHYIVGRWSGIHADVFSIGFGPVLFSRQDRHGTRWQIAALPLGGYVKFAGDSDAASSGKDDDAFEEMSEAERRRTMHGAPLWARSATVAAGPLFNFVLSILVFAGFYLASGVPTDRPVVGEITPLPVQQQELRSGDRILSVGGEPTPDNAAFFAAIDGLEPAPQVSYRVARNGDEREVVGPYPLPPLAASVQPQSAARDAGLQQGDVVLAVNGTPIYSFNELRDQVGAYDGAPLLLDIWRAGEQLEVELEPRRMDLPLPEGGFETRWLIGISGGLFFEVETRRPGLGEAAMLGVSQTGFIIQTSLSGLYHMITGAISSCNLRGPIGIAETSGAMAADGLSSFIWFIAVLSTAIGLLNLFPVPVLDGGHLVFHAYEAVAGKPPSDRALRILMAVGLALILTLMVFALTNDLFCP